MPAFQLYDLFRTNATTFPPGTVIDHWTLTYVSGPTSLPAVTLQYGDSYADYPFALPGAYVVSAQAFDASNNPLGSAANISFNLQDPIGTPPGRMPSYAYCIGSTGPTNFTLRFLRQSLGQLGGASVDHCIVTLTGPTAKTGTLAGAAETLTFTGMAEGLYSYSLQSQDINNNNLGPAMNGRFLYFAPEQRNVNLRTPNAVGMPIMQPSNNTNEPL